jgi:hypothetical protein
MTPKYMRNLRRNINDRFSQSEIKGLVFDLGIDWEHLTGEEKPVKIRSLLSKLQREGKLNSLIELLRGV